MFDCFFAPIERSQRAASIYNGFRVVEYLWGVGWGPKNSDQISNKYLGTVLKGKKKVGVRGLRGVVVFFFMTFRVRGLRGVVDKID